MVRLKLRSEISPQSQGLRPIFDPATLFWVRCAVGISRLNGTSSREHLPYLPVTLRRAIKPTSCGCGWSPFNIPSWLSNLSLHVAMSGDPAKEQHGKILQRSSYLRMLKMVCIMHTRGKNISVWCTVYAPIRLIQASWELVVLHGASYWKILRQDNLWKGLLLKHVRGLAG